MRTSILFQLMLTMLPTIASAGSFRGQTAVNESLPIIERVDQDVANKDWTLFGDDTAKLYNKAYYAYPANYGQSDDITIRKAQARCLLFRENAALLYHTGGGSSLSGAKPELMRYRDIVAHLAPLRGEAIRCLRALEATPSSQD